jgi:hypothetical protein
MSDALAHYTNDILLAELRERGLKLTVEHDPFFIASPVATRVKPLKWSQFNGRIGAYKPFGGSYVITEYPGMKQPFALEQHFSGSLTQYYENADDAKAAAQADYEQRILSALEEPKP